MRYLRFAFVILFTTLLLVSCSGQPASTPGVEGDLTPLSNELQASNNPSQTYLWGLYEISIDPDTKTATIELNRHAMFAVNIVNILNEHPKSLQVNVASVHHGSYGTIIYADVTLTHPFPGVAGLNGYDVRGVFMGNGSGTLAYNPSLKYPLLPVDQSIDGINSGSADKPDGYTRWFNQPEFSTGGLPLFSYTQGNQSTAGYSPAATLCPYHYYADGLGATEDACDWLKANIGSFGAFKSGSVNTRRFTVRFPTPETKFKFGYAIIASWKGMSPASHPANADESVAAEATVANTLYYESPEVNGGDLTADFTLYAWKGLPTSIVIESTVLSSNHTLTPSEMVPIETGYNWATWHVEIPADNVQGPSGNEFWVIAEYANSNYKNNAGTINLAGDDALAAYFRFDLPVSHNCGQFAWAKKAGGQLTDRGRAITTLSDDSVVAAGEFSQVFPPSSYENIPATFGEGEPNETTLVDPKYGNIFIARYNTDGTLRWARGAGGVGYDYAAAITALSDDAIVITGCFGATSYTGAKPAVFGEGEPNETELEATNQHGSFYIACYNPDGTLRWAKRAVGEPTYNNEHTQRGAAVAALSNDMIIVTGVFGNKAIFGEGEPKETALVYTPYYWDIFIACYNPNGTLAWAKRQGGSELEQSMAITALSDVSFVITGLFGTQDVKPATFGNGQPNETSLYTYGNDDIFIARYYPDGSFAWVKQAGGVMNDAGYGICSLSDKSVILSGSYGNPGDPDEGPALFGDGEANETLLEHAGWDDIFIARYNSNGALVWAKRAASVSQEITHGVATLSGDMVALTGEFWVPLTFGEGEPNETTLTPYPDTDPNFDYDDIFVAWYNPDGTVACAQSAGGKSYDCSYGITSLSDDSVALTGDFAGTYGATFGEGEPGEVTYYGQGIEMFVAHYFK